MLFNPMMFMTGTANTSVVESIMSIFTAIGTWFVSMITAMLPIFYTAEEGLTIIGVLTVCGLGVATILLVVNFIRKFFHWR